MLKHSSIIKKLFFSYLLLTIPVLFVSFLMSNLMTEKVKNEVNARTAYQEKQILDTLNEQFVFYRNSSTVISTTPELSRNKVLKNSALGQKGIDYLHNVKLLNRNIYDVFVYYGENALYSATGYVRPGVYFRTALSCTPEAEKLALEVIGSDETGVFYLDSEDGGYLLFHYPGRKDMGGGMYINYCMSFSALKKMLEPVLETNPVLIKIMFQNGGNPFQLYMEGNMERGIQIMEEARLNEYENNKKDYIFLSNHSELVGTTLEVSYRSDDIYLEAYRWQKINGFFTAGLLLVSTMLSYFLSRSHYRKINQLKNSLEAVQPSKDSENTSEKDKPDNEFDYMQKIVQNIMAENTQRKLETVETRHAMKYQTALLLYHGMLEDEHTIRQMLEDCGVKLGKGYFFIACIAYLPKDQSILEIFKTRLEFNCFCEIKIEDRKALAILFELSSEDMLMKKREKIGRGILSELLELKLNHTRIGFSRTFQDITQTSYAYLEALNVLKKLLNTGSRQKIGYMDPIMESRGHILQFKQQDIDNFTEALKNRDMNDAVAYLGELLHYMKNPDITAENSQYLKYRILQMIFSVLRESGEMEYEMLAKEIAQIESADDKEFRENLTVILKKICTGGEDGNEDFLKGIRYINQNFSRADLSLDEVAEYMGFSKSYTSRIFKEKTGSRYIEYLTQLRMEKAKALLTETDMTVKDISNAVGYYNVPGFRKKFKEYYGVSASQYRNRPAEEEGSDEND